MTPGSDFGDFGEGMLRFCYAVSEETLELALTRLGRVLPQLESASSEVGHGGGDDREASA